MTKELRRRWLAGVSGAIILLAGPALAGTTSNNDEINLKIDALEQQIQDLKNAGLNIRWEEIQKAHTIAGEPELSVIREFIKAGYPN